jgi:hypothetical protein
MRSLRAFCGVLILSALLVPAAARAALPVPPDFQPDPKSVQRYGPAYRYPQAGWIVLHIEGEPYERGYQHGRLLAPEIAAYVRCFAALQSPETPNDGWKLTRSLVNSLFVRRYDKEYLEEMRGIADGANDAGARFDNRPLDLVDIVGLNSWAEVETLNSALEATPTGLEGLHFPRPQLKAVPPPKPVHCSAFAATGPATADGKIVFGHITMFGLYPSNFFNVWLDVKPAKGHRVLMQGYPGTIQSGMDYYLNDGGLLVCETTLAQTRFEIKGMAVASRIRQALQYADSIDKAVDILKQDNNGLYTNEWLLADIKTNEIAMFELGTAKSKLYRSSKNEWFGGTEGFYWGCNNTKDLEVRLETIPGTDGRPANMVFVPSDRDKAWLRLYARNRGKIAADFGKEAFTTPPIAAHPSIDAKFTTSDLAKDLKTWALFGPPLGRTWEPTREEHGKYPEIRSLVSNPWTVLHPGMPGQTETAEATLADLPGRLTPPDEAPRDKKKERQRKVVSSPPWHGTLLPKTDADTWLAAAFADYEELVSKEQAFRQEGPDNNLGDEDREKLAMELFAYRSSYLAAARAAGDVPLAKTHADITQDGWYRMADGKGVLLLHELRRLLGDDAFAKMMDDFGREHAGKETSTAEFQAHAEKAVKVPAGFFDYWLHQPGLPELRLGKTTVVPLASKKDKGDVKGYRVEGRIRRTVSAKVARAGTGAGEDDRLPKSKVEVTVETASGDVSKEIELDGVVTPFAIEIEALPRRVVVDRYGHTPRGNGSPYTVLSFNAEPDQALIIYGTADETASNREAAEALQEAIRKNWTNQTVPIKSDKEATDEDLKAHHVLLIGRPDSNTLVERFRAALPVHFGSRSFVVGKETYAHEDSAVIAAAANPLNPRYSLTVVAGLGAAATLRAAPKLLDEDRAGDVLVMTYGAKPQALVVPPREVVHEFKER